MQAYLLRDPNSGRVRYVGISTVPRIRFNSHISTAKLGRKDRAHTHCARWIRTLIAKGQKPTLEIIENIADENWKERERYWIQHFRAVGEPLTNLTDGGEGTFGHRQPPETRSKHSLARKKYFQSEEARIAQSHALQGHLVTEETRAKIRAKALGRKQSPEWLRARMGASKRGVISARLNGPVARCAECDKEFHKIQSRQRFCSRACKCRFTKRVFLERRSRAQTFQGSPVVAIGNSTWTPSADTGMEAKA